jgi:NADH-quinone oxidoreductase subunit H
VVIPLVSPDTLSYAEALPPDWPGGFWAHMLVFVILLIIFITIVVLLFTWLERRWLGRLQIRPGPNRAGPFGLLQPIADVVKLLMKEDIVPDKADKWVHWLAPVVALAPALLVFAVIPFQDGALLADLNIGILFIMAVSSVVVVGVFMAGWGSSNKYSLLGAMRTIAQEVSYEIPLVLSILGVVIISGTLSLNEMVKAQQDVAFIFVQPLGFVIYITAALAEVARTPFDTIEADSELVAGFHTEYSGMKFALFFLVEYAETLAVAAIATTLFLGGWQGPFLPPWMWFIIKLFAVFMFIIWVRGTIPRLRIDQVMGFAWKFLLPLALLNLLFTGVEVLAWPDAPLVALGLINLVVGAALVLLMSKLFKLGGGRVPV